MSGIWIPLMIGMSPSGLFSLPLLPAAEPAVQVRFVAVLVHALGALLVTNVHGIPAPGALGELVAVFFA